MPPRDNGIIAPVRFAVPAKIKHFIIVLGDKQSPRAELASNYQTPPTPALDIRTSAPPHSGMSRARGEMRSDGGLIKSNSTFSQAVGGA